MATDVKFLHIYVIVTLSLLCAIRTEALSLGYDSHTARDSRLNSYLKTVLDPLREHMRKGFPKYGIPVLDPFVYGNFSKTISSDVVNASVFVQDMTISGLSNFSLHRLDAYLRNLSVIVKVIFPKVILTSVHYQLNGSAVTVLPLLGDGEVSAHINEVELTVELTFSIPTPGKIKMDDASLDIDYGSASVLIEDVMGGGSLSDFINTFLSSPRAKKYFKMVKPGLLKTAINLLKEKANKMLSKLDLSKVDL